MEMVSREIPAVLMGGRFQTQFATVNADCLAVARRLVERGETVAVLNMANRQTPGGGVLHGSRAQEEQMFRRSDYYRFLYQYADVGEVFGVRVPRDLSGSYPMHRDFGGIFTPNVTVFRDDEKSGYAFLAKPWRVNFIAVAAMNRPDTVTVNGEELVAPYLVPGIKNKMRTILRLALRHGQTSLVLGAFGCGAFRNPPAHTARLFHEVFTEREFAGAFNRVYFAVLDDGNAALHGGNFRHFASVFGELPMNFI